VYPNLSKLTRLYLTPHTSKVPVEIKFSVTSLISVGAWFFLLGDANSLLTAPIGANNLASMNDDFFISSSPSLTSCKHMDKTLV
jgi:hypothetical protein